MGPCDRSPREKADHQEQEKEEQDDGNDPNHHVHDHDELHEHDVGYGHAEDDRRRHRGHGAHQEKRSLWKPTGTAVLFNTPPGTRTPNLLIKRKLPDAHQRA